MNENYINQMERLTPEGGAPDEAKFEAKFKDKWPKLWALLQTETLSLECDIGDQAKINGGMPTITAMMVKRDADPQVVVQSARPIVRLKFGNSDSDKGRPDALTFYGPDGNVFKQLSDDEGMELNEAVTNAELSELWGFEGDSPFMHKVGEVLVKTSLILNAACEMSQVTGQSIGRTFEALSRHAFDANIASVASIHKDGRVTDADGNPVSFEKHVAPKAVKEGAE